MFSRYKVRSVAEMKEKIKSFVCIVCGIEQSSRNIRVFTKDNGHILWFMDEPYGISAWITDTVDYNVDGSRVTDDPRLATSTVGLAGKYVRDVRVTVLDSDATSDARRNAREYYERWKNDNYGSIPNDVRGRVTLRQVNRWISAQISAIQRTKKKWERLYDTNVFHIGGALRFSDVPVKDGFKFLDCHYNDGVFGFFLFSPGDVKTTNTLIIGEYVPAQQDNVDKTFLLSNTFQIVSETKNPGYGDSFPYESIVGVETFELVGEQRIIHYDNELFRLVQYDVDGEPAPKEYSVNGVKVGLRQNIAPVHIQVWNKNLDDNDDESRYASNIKVVEWYWRELHCTYECEESNVGINYYPLLDTRKKSYKQYDPYIPGADPFSGFMGFMRCGTGGNSVNTNNNISECMPLIFYVLRDPDNIDSWSNIGMTDIVGYINMYNMSSGRVLQSTFRNNYRKHACYDLYKRRCPYTPWSPNENEPRPGNLYREAWGFGGFPGIYFRLDDETTKNALAIGRGRLI